MRGHDLRYYGESKACAVMAGVIRSAMAFHKNLQLMCAQTGTSIAHTQSRTGTNNHYDVGARRRGPEAVLNQIPKSCCNGLSLASYFSIFR